MLINDTVLAHEPIALIRQARAYGQYRSSLERAQHGEVNDQDDYFALCWNFSGGMNFPEFTECVRNWFFIDRLEREGEPAQREVLERGWMAYEQVPEQVKRDLGLLEEEGD